MMTAHATVENAIEAMKLGAYDYLQKPFEVEELLVAVRRALEHQSLSRQHRYLLSEREEEFGHYGIVGRSRAVEELLRRIELVARSKSTVLVTGERARGRSSWPGPSTPGAPSARCRSSRSTAPPSPRPSSSRSSSAT